MRVEIVDRDGLIALAPAWRDLWDRASAATVFQRPEWCLPWCEHLLDGEVHAITVWRGSSLQALLPLFAWRDRDAQVLSLIGAGVSDYADLLLGDEEALTVLAQTLQGLAWNRIELSEVPESSPLLRLALAGAHEIVEQEACPDLAVAMGAPLANVPAAFRRDIDYQRRRAAREVGFEEVRLSGAHAIDALAKLHRARWSMRGEAGVLDDRRTRFLCAAAEQLAASEALVGLGVRFGDELAAIALVLFDRDRARYYLGGFAPAHERRSPGTLAIAAAIEHAAHRGAARFDFLRGREAYKYRFGARDRVQLRRRVVQRC